MYILCDIYLCLDFFLHLNGPQVGKRLTVSVSVLELYVVERANGLNDRSRKMVEKHRVRICFEGYIRLKEKMF